MQTRAPDSPRVQGKSNRGIPRELSRGEICSNPGDQDEVPEDD